MGGSMKVEVHDVLNPVASDVWRCLFPRRPCPDSLAEQIARFYGQEVRLFSIVVSYKDSPVVLLPLCMKKQTGSVSAVARTRDIITKLGRMMPSGLKRQILDATVVGETAGLIGIDFDHNAEVLLEARNMAYGVFESLSRMKPVETIEPELAYGRQVSSIPAGSPV